MERRSLIKGALLTAATVPAVSVLGSAPEADAQEPQGIGKVDIKPISPDYFVPKRFDGRTMNGLTAQTPRQLLAFHDSM